LRSRRVTSGAGVLTLLSLSCGLLADATQERKKRRNLPAFGWSTCHVTLGDFLKKYIKPRVSQGLLLLQNNGITLGFSRHHYFGREDPWPLHLMCAVLKDRWVLVTLAFPKEMAGQLVPTPTKQKEVNFLRKFLLFLLVGHQLSLEFHLVIPVDTGAGAVVERVGVLTRGFQLSTQQGLPEFP
jgi:hypothetical protein